MPVPKAARTVSTPSEQRPGRVAIYTVQKFPILPTYIFLIFRKKLIHLRLHLRAVTYIASVCCDDLKPSSSLVSDLSFHFVVP